MAHEIERKFLVKDETFKVESMQELKIIQGFLSSVPERTVRIRISGNKGFITVKGISNESGTSRFEWEKEIDIADALDLLKLCEHGVIHKTRFNIRSDKHIFEVDEFHADNEGLIVAEIELSSENESFQKPNWLGKEVTGELKYYNSMLMKNPFKDWNL
jgi:adenylate cyclase